MPTKVRMDHTKIRICYSVLMTRFLRYSLVFLLALAWFSFFQPWGSFNDPDAFYHAKIASLMAAQGPPVASLARDAGGPVQSFPWLDLTSLGQHFVDQHFLFHVLLIPLIYWRGMLPGAQLAAVIFAAGFIVAMYALLRRLKVLHPSMWILLLAISAPLIVRLSLAKASPLALIWFMLGVTAMLLRRPWWGVVAGLGFALTHGGWMILLGCQALMLMGEFVYRRVMGEPREWRGIFIFFTTIIGIAFGLLLHPNSKNLLSFLWVQVIKVGVATPIGRVFLGEEWLPIAPLKLLFALMPLVIAAFVVLFGFLFARQATLDRTRARQIIAVSLPLAILVAMTLKSYRFVEYLIPILVVWLASLWSLVDATHFYAQAKEAWREVMHSVWLPLEKIALATGLCLFIALLAWDVRGAFYLLHTRTRPFDQFQSSMQAISALANPGDRVFHSNWDQFPQLFVLDDRLRYVAGLDPTFLLEANPELSDLYRDVTLGRTTSNLFFIIHSRFHARFVFVEPLGHEVFAQALRADSHFVSLYHDSRVFVYEVR